MRADGRVLWLTGNGGKDFRPIFEANARFEEQFEMLDKDCKRVIFGAKKKTRSKATERHIGALVKFFVTILGVASIVGRRKVGDDGAEALTKTMRASFRVTNATRNVSVQEVLLKFCAPPLQVEGGLGRLEPPRHEEGWGGTALHISEILMLRPRVMRSWDGLLQVHPPRRMGGLPACQGKAGPLHR